ncbi:hypothetical protein EON65_56015, partial [archaeon]
MRLYRVSPSTGGYEPIENGGPLGSVIIGSGVSFQLLVYNAQKAPQALVPIGGNFDYTLRDTYMSFTDKRPDTNVQTSWSLLFDTTDTMRTFLTALNFIISHILSHSETTEGGVITRPLPPDASIGGSEVVVGSG